MKSGLIAVAVLVPLLTGVAAYAQDDDKPLGFTYATYLYCDTGEESEFDEQVEKVEKPVLDKLVADGEMTRWGYMRHHTGGQWRRIRWFGAETVDGAIAALDSMGQALEAVGEEAGEPSDACDRHDDYLWELKSGTLGKDRGKVGMSVYFSCKVPSEERADEIHDALFAPALNRLVDENKLASWGWQSHVIGGWFRRLQTMTAKDYSTLLSARGELLESVYGEDNAAGAEFAEICGPHHDYLWEIVHEG